MKWRWEAGQGEGASNHLAGSRRRLEVLADLLGVPRKAEFSLGEEEHGGALLLLPWTRMCVLAPSTRTRKYLTTTAPLALFFLLLWLPGSSPAEVALQLQLIGQRNPPRLLHSKIFRRPGAVGLLRCEPPKGGFRVVPG